MAQIIVQTKQKHSINLSWIKQQCATILTILFVSKKIQKLKENNLFSTNILQL